MSLYEGGLFVYLFFHLEKHPVPVTSFSLFDCRGIAMNYWIRSSYRKLDDCPYKNIITVFAFFSILA